MKKIDKEALLAPGNKKGRERRKLVSRENQEKLISKMERD